MNFWHPALAGHPWDMTRRPPVILACALVALAACAPPGGPADPNPAVTHSASAQASLTPSTTPVPTAGMSGSRPAASPSPAEESSVTGAPETSADPRWRFFTGDDTRYASPWFDGRHRIMIGFGCTVAPYYRSDTRCPAGQGFHHGIDVAIPCGETLRSAVAGRVVLGGLGSAYGDKALRIRTGDHDFLVGHARRLLVRDGELVAPGQPIGEVGALGAPDGCHLHLEQRSVGGGLSSASDPAAVLALRS